VLEHRIKHFKTSVLEFQVFIVIGSTWFWAKNAGFTHKKAGKKRFYPALFHCSGHTLHALGVWECETHHALGACECVSGPFSPFLGVCFHISSLRTLEQNSSLYKVSEAS